MKYDHTQISKVGIAGMIIVGFLAVLSAFYEDYTKYAPQWMDTSHWDWFAVAIVVGIYLFAINMMILRIRISDSEIMWGFGIGFPRKKLNLADITSIEKVTNKWWYGWGIRKIITGGWLYSVYGLQAVEIKTANGKSVRLGTDEPKKLYRVLKNQLQLDEGDDAHG